MKIISFNVDNTQYSIKMDSIREVMVYPKRIAKLPNQSDRIIGVTNIRGNVTPIINLNKVLGTPNTEPKYLIIIESKNGLISFPTDNIPITKDITGLTIDKDFAMKSDIIDGIVNTDKGLIVILDVKSLNQ